MTPASRPSLLSQENGEPDYVMPRLIEEVPEARRLFTETMERIWEGIAQLRAAGASEQDALYLLPNAKALRYTESAELLHFRHKAAMRLCYNAQEEIWRLSYEECEQIAESHPGIGRFLLPPCGLRRLAGTSPACPEGSRYCGVPVWRLERRDYRRSL
jgi:thymidylate synthase ThyX